MASKGGTRRFIDCYVEQNQTSRLEWWSYVLIALGLFFIALILSFVVKKINEVRLHERLRRLQEKVSRNRCTQVQEPHNSVPIESIPTPIHKQSANSTTQGKSHVCNKDDNLNNARSKSEPNLPSKSNLASQSNIDENNSKLNFLGAIYTNMIPPKKVNEKPVPIQICDNHNNNIFKEILDKKEAKMF